MKIRTEKVISVQDWDELVSKTYGRPYSFQQQDGCKERQRVNLTVPCGHIEELESELPDSIPEELHGGICVRFATWLGRDPKAPIVDGGTKYLDLWWARNFYPDVQVVANDLHQLGLIEAGEYVIDIDW